MSNKSLQVCHCGWSKVTSYQGLRIHQGKKGCTPNTSQENDYSMFSLSSPRTAPTSLINLENPLLDRLIYSTDGPPSDWSIMDQMTHSGVAGNAQSSTALSTMNPGFRNGPPLPHLQHNLLENQSITWNPTLNVAVLDELQLVISGLPLYQPPDNLKIPSSQMTFLPQMGLFQRPSTQTVASTSGLKTATGGAENPQIEAGRTMLPYTPAPPETPTLDGAATTHMLKKSNSYSRSEASIVDHRNLQVLMENMSTAKINSGNNSHILPNQPNQEIGRSTLDDWSKTQALMSRDLDRQHNADNSEAEIQNLTFQTPQGDPRNANKVEPSRRRLDFSADQPKVAEQLTNDVTSRDQREKENEKTSQKLLKARQDQLRAFLQQETRGREKKLVEVRSTVKDCTEHLAAEWSEIDAVFLEVMKIVEDSWQRALQPLEQRRMDVENDSSVVVQTLSQDLGDFKKKMEEMERNPVQVPSMKTMNKSKDWKKLSVNTEVNFGTLRTTTSSMMDQINQKLEKLSSIEINRIPSFEVDVKLDPETAHSCLVVSPDCKSVHDGGNKREGSESPTKFSVFGSILASNRFTSGKHYWEVEVTNKTGWDLGVASVKANRKGQITLQSDKGYWIIVHYEGNKFAAMSVPPTSLSLKDRPEKVGVFVDHEEGLVSFYDVTHQSHIYSYTGCSFTEEIMPYFSPHLSQNQKNADPLIICSVKK